MPTCRNARVSHRTPAEEIEWYYVYRERLGILAEDQPPEPWMKEMAERDADAAIERMRLTSSASKSQ